MYELFTMDLDSPVVVHVASPARNCKNHYTPVGHKRLLTCGREPRSTRTKCWDILIQPARSNAKFTRDPMRIGYVTRVMMCVIFLLAFLEITANDRVRFFAQLLSNPQRKLSQTVLRGSPKWCPYKYTMSVKWKYEYISVASVSIQERNFLSYIFLHAYGLQDMFSIIE